MNHSRCTPHPHYTILCQRNETRLHSYHFLNPSRTRYNNDDVRTEILTVHSFMALRAFTLVISPVMSSYLVWYTDESKSLYLSTSNLGESNPSYRGGFIQFMAQRDSHLDKINGIEITIHSFLDRNELSIVELRCKM
jgi:hypothetical protein